MERPMRELCLFSASACADEIARGRMTSEALVESCLARIAARDGSVRAWVHLNPSALEQARACDRREPSGPLHGVPVAIKDVIETGDQPTAYGSPLFAGHRPQSDAACVTRLREAGAIILGKVATAEFATYNPSATVNPLCPTCTPGGSSSGSAAAVADFHVPIALGTQTAGSIIRPASFCGILGFKPTQERWPREGMLDTSPSLDTIGAFARSVDDLILLDRVLGGGRVSSAIFPRLGLCGGPMWLSASSEMRAAFRDSADGIRAAGLAATECALPRVFDGLAEAQRIVHIREVFLGLGALAKHYPQDVSAAFAAMVEEGACVGQYRYEEALALVATCRDMFPTVFREFDLLLAPAAPGVAPLGLEATGDPIFSRMWTAIGAPCLSFPAALDGAGLPLGLQLIGMRGADSVLLEGARQIVEALAPWPVFDVPERRHLTRRERRNA